MSALAALLRQVPPLTDATLTQVEQAVSALLDDQPSEAVRVLGYGEITVAVAAPASQPVWACKRLPPFADRAAAERYAAQVEDYRAQLVAAGVNVVDTLLKHTTSREGAAVLYLVQAVFPAEALAVTQWRQRPPRPDDAILQDVLRQLLAATTPRLALDAQLANWVWDGSQAWQFDLSTPFMRDAEGRDVLDSQLVAMPYPALLRPALRRWVVPGVLAKYHDRRGVMADFAGNLLKEDLAPWLPAVLAAFNRHIETPLQAAEVAALYAADARLWEWMHRLKRASRAWSRHVRRQPYPYLLSPPIERHTGVRHA